MVGRDREDGKSCKATSPFQSPYSKAQWNSEHSLLTKSVEKNNFMQLFRLRTPQILFKNQTTCDGELLGGVDGR